MKFNFTCHCYDYVRLAAEIVLEKQADGERCVGRDVLNSRMSTTADYLALDTVPLTSVCVHI